MFFGIGNVDIINAYAAADNQLETAGGCGSVDDRLAHFGGGAHHQHVIVFYLLGQLVGFIELLVYLVAQVLQFFNGGCFHAVGC